MLFSSQDDKVIRKCLRASSSTNNELNHTKKIGTSHNSMKQLPGFSKQLVGKEFEKDLLFKIKPKKIFIDKEQVFQENLELKLKVHSLSEETLKLRTKIMQIENELSRKEDQYH